MNGRRILSGTRATVLLSAWLLLWSACGGGGSEGSAAVPGSADLAAFATARIEVGGVELVVWLAETDSQRARGFMLASAEQIAPLDDGTPRGMLFVYPDDRRPSFFMRDTFVPLDLAFATADGTIVEVHRLEPLDETRVTAAQPVRLALEAPAGTFARHGIGPGDRIER